MGKTVSVCVCRLWSSQGQVKCLGIEERIKTSPESGGLTEWLLRNWNHLFLGNFNAAQSVSLRDGHRHKAHCVYEVCACDLNVGRTHSPASSWTLCHLSTQTTFYSWNLPNPFSETQHPKRFACLVLMHLVANADLKNSEAVWGVLTAFTYLYSWCRMTSVRDDGYGHAQLGMLHNRCIQAYASS